MKRTTKGYKSRKYKETIISTMLWNNENIGRKKRRTIRRKKMFALAKMTN